MKKSNAEAITNEADKALQPHLDALENHKNNVSKLSTATIWIKDYVGTIGFFISILVCIIGWFSWNMFAPKRFQFDHSPTFVEWALLSSIIQLLLLPLILVGQKIESKEAHLRSEADLEINKQAEKENQAILHHLEHQDKLLTEIIGLLKQEKRVDGL